jgi:hypothetical protein
MQVGIEAVRNGYIVRIPYECTDEFNPNLIREEVLVFEYEYEEEAPEALRNALYAIMDGIGEYGSRYAEKRVRIKLEHGDKYECTKTECSICNEVLEEAQYIASTRSKEDLDRLHKKWEQYVNVVEEE